MTFFNSEMFKELVTILALNYFILNMYCKIITRKDSK